MVCSGDENTEPSPSDINPFLVKPSFSTSTSNTAVSEDSCVTVTSAKVQAIEEGNVSLNPFPKDGSVLGEFSHTFIKKNQIDSVLQANILEASKNINQEMPDLKQVMFFHFIFFILY